MNPITHTAHTAHTKAATNKIILSTLNARYIHSSLGLRYILANMGELKKITEINEFIINTRPIDIVERLLDKNPNIIGFGVYIWNVEQTTQVIALIKQIKPEITIVIGGPEVSFEQEEQKICQLADYVVCGAGDLEFPELCQQLFSKLKPINNIIQARPRDLASLAFPYDEYTDEDVKNRVIYVEASRGCPFKCEFCLSALDKTAVAFDLEKFLAELDKLYQRGVRHFKFVDRTFNLKIQSSIRILEFFLERLDENLFLHFELIPDHLPEKIKTIILKFPDGTLQFEIGIQSFNPDVQDLISRKQDNDKSEKNIRWLKNETHAHMHTDLILGLPGETLKSIEEGFNQLVKLNPHEIQVGILKRLRGTPLIRHTEKYQLRFNPDTPYNILSNVNIDFKTMQRLTRFARYWDMIANSGRFKHSKQLMLGERPFSNFLKLSDWLFKTTGQTHQISLARLFELIFMVMTQHLDLLEGKVKACLWEDYLASSLKGNPSFADGGMIKARNKKIDENRGANKRQNRH